MIINISAIVEMMSEEFPACDGFESKVLFDSDDGVFMMTVDWRDGAGARYQTSKAVMIRELCHAFNLNSIIEDYIESMRHDMECIKHV